MFSRLRSTCYGLTLACAIGTTIIGFLAAFIDDPIVVRSRIFGLNLGIFSFFAWMWISFLTAYHDHTPNPKDALSRAQVHTVSYAIMVPLWLAFGIGLFVQASTACLKDTNNAAQCSVTAISGALPLIGALLAGGCVFAIRRSNASINSNETMAYVAYTPLRTALYVWTLTATVITSILGVTAAALDTFAPHLRVFGICLTVVSFPTWIWLSILTSYHMSPNANQFLTRASTHFYTFVTISPPFLAFGIGTLSQQSYNCNPIEPDSDGLASGWCGLSVVAGALSLLVALLSVATALAIQFSGAGAGLQRNVCLKYVSEEKPGEHLIAAAVGDA